MELTKMVSFVMFLPIVALILIMGLSIYSEIEGKKECQDLSEKADMIFIKYKSGGLFSNSECWAMNPHTKEINQIG